MKRVMIIGVDSLDPLLLKKFEDELPNIKRLIDSGQSMSLKSIFPPDSVPAWVSIYTGLNPAKHGLLHSFDIFEGWHKLRDLNIDSIQGKTFWDYAGSAGRKVFILLPLAAYPPWPINGVMISRSLIKKDELEAYPPMILDDFGKSMLKNLEGKHPGKKNLGDYADQAKQIIKDTTDFGLKASQEYEWDLFFLYISELDIIQHFFWRYYDETDPTYPLQNSYRDIIKQFYILIDRIIGKFIELHPDVTCIVMSDHGHGMRPPQTVNLNEFLRKKGYLKINYKANLTSILVGKAKTSVLGFCHKMDLMYWLVQLGKSKSVSGVSKGVYTSSMIIDIDNSMAYLSYFTGAKSYSQGGITINTDKLDRDYESFRKALIRDLQELDDRSGKKLFDWIKTREELYRGDHISIFPDIVFKLKEGYGIYWDVHSPLIGTSYEHTLSSGGHKENAVFLISNCDKCAVKKEMTLMDVAPTILDLLDVPIDIEFDGQSIFQGSRH